MHRDSTPGICQQRIADHSTMLTDKRCLLLWMYTHIISTLLNVTSQFANQRIEVHVYKYRASMLPATYFMFLKSILPYLR